MYGPASVQAFGAPPASQQQQKHDIFVGNLNFSTTEEQLHQAFSEIGRVLKVRMVHDLETGKPRGFAFIEFEDPQVALSAIRNMNDYELNGRRIRVNFSNSSHLEALAGKLGMDLTNTASQQTSRGSGGGGPSTESVSSGTQTVADALKGFSKAEMYDVVAKLKEIADKDPDEARRLLSGHPQLPEAMLHLMSKLDMIQTPVMTAPPPVLAPPPPRVADPRQRPADPRAAVTATTAVPPPPPVTTTAPPPPPLMDPRQRMAAVDPRQQQQQAYGSVPPPPPMMQQPPPQGGAVNLDPTLVQQVMSLSEEQIQQLPPDKQQSIRTLRQQITGGM
jgi:cleavage stimulation factor subunit 2